MSHVDKGALHAYLDGALDEYPTADAERIREHLDRCAECADRLATERQVRADAAAMLGLAAPDVEMPSLEELRTYVKATRPKRSPAAVRLYRMGWAASVVLAVGAGWMVRDGQLPPVLPAELDESFQTIGSSDAIENAPAAVVESPARFSDDRDDASVNAVAPTKTLASVGATVEAIVDPDERVAAEPALRTLEAAGARKEAAQPAMQVVAVEPSAAELIPLDAGAGSGAVGDVVAELPAVGGVIDSVRSDEVESSVMALNERRAGEDQAFERRRAESPVPVTSALRQGVDFANSPVPEEEERDLVDEPSLVVPGYEVLSVTNIGEGTTPIGVHVVQRLAGDETLEVFHLQLGVDPAVVATPTDGRNEVREEVGNGWIIIHARLTDEELGSLLARLLPEEGPAL